MKVPYPMVPAVHSKKRYAHMAVAVHYANKHGRPRLRQQPLTESKTLNIACYGPSLQDTWQDLKRPIMSMSGSLKFLVERGIVPDYHIDMDPRENKLLDITPVVPGVHYLMASIAPQGTWELLKDEQLTLWHVYFDQEIYDWVERNDPGTLIVHGASTIGLTAVHVGRVMGYTHFEIHGMDGSYKDNTRTERHAGPHTGHTQLKNPKVWPVYGKKYATTDIMANAVVETLNQVKNFPWYTIFHGHGLTQQLIRKRNYKTAACADQTEKVEAIRNARVRVVEGTPLPVDIWDRLYSSSVYSYGDKDTRMVEDLTNIRKANELRREKAHYNTGTITLEQMIQLRLITEKFKPKTIIEIGTFIGNSAMAMNAQKIYTCDRDNDCLESTDVIKTFPGKSSTQMFAELVDQKIQAEMFFFDGRLADVDLQMVQSLSAKGAIYILDDFTGIDNNKGYANAAKLLPILSGYSLIEPDKRVNNSTLAIIVPVELLTVEPPKEELKFVELKEGALA